MSDAPLKIILSGQSLVRHDPRAMPDSRFTALNEIIDSASVGFTNFEGVLRGAPGGWPTKEHFIHDAPSEVMAGLKALGFNLVSLANNHAFDLGPTGVLHTRQVARAAGLTTAGSGTSLAEAGQASVVTTDRGTVALVAMDASGLPDLAYARDADELLDARPGLNPLRIRRTVELPLASFREFQRLTRELGESERQRRRLQMGYPQPRADERLNFYGAWLKRGETAREAFEPDGADLARNLATIRSAAAMHDVVVAYVHQHHWSPDWQQTAAWLRLVGEACIEAGADIFVSHGVPMLMEIGVHHRRPMFFGLGSLFFDTRRPERYADPTFWQSLLVEVLLTGDSVAIQLHPLVLEFKDGRSIPHLADLKERRSICALVQSLSPSVQLDGLTLRI
ncbi:MAG: CapA family protein [Wenzhouxiangella sp.]|nr:CapA family protein [Wenzhouxiangella sp.]MCH8478792.1 CapA family protein [Wenzhouxiangella sp.]